MYEVQMVNGFMPEDIVTLMSSNDKEGIILWARDNYSHKDNVIVVSQGEFGPKIEWASNSQN